MNEAEENILNRIKVKEMINQNNFNQQQLSTINSLN